MKESRFQSKVIKWFESIGGYVVNIWGGGYQRAGIPDLLICYKGRFVALELKTYMGKVHELQRYNISEIHNAGGFARILRPSEFKEFQSEVLKWS
jgi:hypothetical protein